jgi:hypothetical protein
MMVDDSSRKAADWLDRTYGGLVALADPRPFVVGERTSLFGCRYAGDGGDRVDQPMLAATIAVPKADGQPFPVANSDPLDESFNLSRPPELGEEPWRWRVNARNCLVATDAAASRRPVSALPWQPGDEAPGWWDRLLTGHFPDSEVAACSSWDEVASGIVEGGPGTRGVVWLRRRHGGVELTGHLLYADYREGTAVILDGQRGSLARLDAREASGLVLARFHRTDARGDDVITAPWEIAAAALSAAIDKANSWLDHTYQGGAVVVDPSLADETRRGWLFACTTKRFQVTGDWRDQMLDAALVVPKAAGEAPFGLPNPDPWTWFARWEEGDAELPLPPAPGVADWFAPMTRQLGEVISVSAHDQWSEVLSEVASFPTESRALVWVRRRDERGRESVGNLLLAANLAEGVQLVDSMVERGRPMLDEDPLGLHVIRFR